MAETNVNVVSHLERLARDTPDALAVHVPGKGGVYESFSYAFLNASADALAHRLASIGVQRETLVAVMVPPGLDFFALTFALFKLAAVPVLIDPGMGIRNLGRCLAEAAPDAFVGIPKAHLARRMFAWAKPSIRMTANVGPWRWGCDISLSAKRDGAGVVTPYPTPPVQADSPAAVLFTSGSTGMAKGVCYTHGIFATQVELLKQTYGIVPGEVDLCTFPLFALFGPALGMACVVPRMNPNRPATIDPAQTAKTLEHFRVTNLFGSPAVVRRLAEWPGRSAKPFATLKRVISAGAPGHAKTIAAVAELLPPGVELFTPYGATEALPVANIGSTEILTGTRTLTEQGHGVCIGRPVAGIQLYVVRITDEPMTQWGEDLLVPDSTVGEFVVRGPIVTKQYHHRPEATRMAKIEDATTGETLHRMGDVGYRDTQGRLWFCGRKSHRVTTTARVLFTDMVEPIFNTVPGILRTALVGVKSGTGIVPVICYEAEPGADVNEALLAKAQEAEQTRGIALFLHYPRAFPVDVRHNSKIFREKLAPWAQRECQRLKLLPPGGQA